MIHLTHKSLMLIAGALWLVVGLCLMPLGLHFLDQCLSGQHHTPLIAWLVGFAPSADYAVVLLIAAALLIGQIKGRSVLAKSALREITRIRALPDPAPLAHLFSRRFYAVMVVMMGLGMSMNVFGMPLDIRGFIDVIVGVALIQGALCYFRQGYAQASYL